MMELNYLVKEYELEMKYYNTYIEQASKFKDNVNIFDKLVNKANRHYVWAEQIKEKINYLKANH